MPVLLSLKNLIRADVRARGAAERGSGDSEAVGGSRGALAASRAQIEAETRGRPVRMLSPCRDCGNVALCGFDF
jgi:hypothetical protein